MIYNFDEIIDRRGTDAIKVERCKTLFGTEDVLPLWVADMDFRTPGFITDAIRKRLEHPILGYTMAVVTGKTFNEGDVEVSEAIDFCHYYPLSMETFSSLKTVELSPKGIILVIPPWNFPLAIPVGGVAAALSGGNSVILKPATVAYPVA